MRSACDSDVQLEDVLHVSLQLGRLLLANGADTTEVESAVSRFAAAFNCEAQLLVTYEALVLTVLAAGRLRTKAGRHLPAMNVNMRAIEALNRIVDETALGQLETAEVRSRLDAVERGLPSYARGIVVAGFGVTAASLAKLLGGDWTASRVALAAGACGTWVRQELSRQRLNLFAIPFVTAFIIGVVGGLAGTMCAAIDPTLCMMAPALLIVPGIPLINAIKDGVSNHITFGLARLSFAGLVVLAITFRLFAAAVLTGVRSPTEGNTQPPPIPLDALFSGVAAIGFALSFEVPVHLWWACVLCGTFSHALRTLLAQFGIGILTGTLLGALVVGLASLVCARRWRSPAPTFAFPGVVALVPGTQAFRTVIGALRISNAGAGASPALVAETVYLAITTLLLAAAIGIGLAVPLAFGRMGAAFDRATALRA